MAYHFLSLDLSVLFSLSKGLEIKQKYGHFTYHNQYYYRYDSNCSARRAWCKDTQARGRRQIPGDFLEESNLPKKNIAPIFHRIGLI